MVQLTRIYTRGGDKGKTSLGSGKRVAKHDSRVAAYGTVDEANAVIGLVRLHAAGTLDDLLASLQNDLFDLGACDRIVIIDSPPLLATSGASVLASLAGQILMVVEAVRTPQRAVMEALRLLGPLDNIGLVLNKA